MRVVASVGLPGSTQLLLSMAIYTLQTPPLTGSLFRFLLRRHLIRFSSATLCCHSLLAHNYPPTHLLFPWDCIPVWLLTLQCLFAQSQNHCSILHISCQFHSLPIFHHTPISSSISEHWCDMPLDSFTCSGLNPHYSIPSLQLFVGATENPSVPPNAFLLLSQQT